ncbi:MAG: PAS domain-containing protein [Acidobacteriota bacterium]|jgi:PAS domain S-box-containing protein
MRDHFAQYFEEMPCYLSVHDRDFRIIHGNQRFRRDFGAQGDYCYRAYKGRDSVCEGCPVEKTFIEGVPQISEQTLHTRDGREIPVRVRTTPIRDEAGQIVAVMEMHTDISESKRLQEQLAHSRQRLAQLFEEVPCYLSVQGPDRIIQHANRRFRETFGPAIGEPCYRVYKHRDEQCIVCNAQVAYREGKPFEHEEVVVSADGREINVLVTTAPLRNARGEVEAVIEMAVDITQIRQLQSQLASIGLLVGSISHGIKGLLTGLDGGLYLVNSGFERGDEARLKKGWEMVVRNVERIRSMVLDILYYAKDRELEVVDVDVAALVAELAEVMDKKAADSNVALRFDVAPGVGTLPGDSKALRAMLVNILENSLEACRAEAGRKDLRVTMSVRRLDPWLVMVVEDNGIGMDRETREKLFSLFFSSKGSKGTGLGLFIANKIVDKHGGSIAVDSEVGRGSRFVIRLPLEARPSTRPTGELAPMTAAATGS